MPNEFLFYGGMVVAGVAIIAGLFAAVALGLGWRILSQKLDGEYGEKRR
jgi:hypothetical protein